MPLPYKACAVGRVPLHSHPRSDTTTQKGRPSSACQKVPSGFFAKLLSELQNQFLYHDFAILPLRRVMERERTP